MIDYNAISADSLHTRNGSERRQKVLTMVKNERMGGYVPKWETKPVNETTAKIEQTLLEAETHNAPTSFSEEILAYQAPAAKTIPEDESFGFADIIDMVNPIQHIPIVGHIYRNFTGDQLKGASQVVGGALYGGPIGAAVGVVNVLIAQETGKDAGEHIIDLVMGTDDTFEAPAPSKIQIARADRGNYPSDPRTLHNDLPASLLAFTPKTYPQS